MPMFFPIRNSCSQGRGPWQRLSASSLRRERKELYSSAIYGNESNAMPSSAIKRSTPGIRRPLSSAFAASPAVPTTATLRSCHFVVGGSRTKLVRDFPSVITKPFRVRPTRFLSTDAAKAVASESNGNGNGEEDASSSFAYLGVLIRRLTMSLGIVYVVNEYFIEWTVCEGPSMMPTIQPRGEIVLIDRCTPRLWGLQGGDTISKRTAWARALQDQHVQTLKKAKKDQREWLLRLYQQEEEKLLQRNNNVPEQGGSLAADDKTETRIGSEETKTKSKQQSSPTSNHSQTTSNNSNAEILRELRQDLERMGGSGNSNIEETWYEPRIPINKLPPEGAWARFRNQVTTGISVGDVVVLQHPDRIGTVCKRVMGLPGDIVTKPSSRLGADRLDALLHGGGRDNKDHPKTRSFWESEEDRLRQLQRNKRRILSAGVKVPDGHIWVEGDNPWNSSDSRNYGAVPANLIMGRVLLRMWPLRGKALMERGDRPLRSDEDELSLTFSGSVVIPAGWDGQKILREMPPSTTMVAANQKTSERRQ